MKSRDQSDWESYLCKMNGELASVFVDLNFSSKAPSASQPKLAWLWIKLNSQRADGLSSDDEFDALCNYEDDLEDALASYETCDYVGRITTTGRREFYFYVSNEFDLEKATDGVLTAHPEYRFQLGEKPDPSWAHYSSVLFPATNGMAQIESRKTPK